MLWEDVIAMMTTYLIQLENYVLESDTHNVNQINSVMNMVTVKIVMNPVSPVLDLRIIIVLLVHHSWTAPMQLPPLLMLLVLILLMVLRGVSKPLRNAKMSVNMKV
jgi:hypothetical protein